MNAVLRMLTALVSMAGFRRVGSSDPVHFRSLRRYAFLSLMAIAGPLAAQPAVTGVNVPGNGVYAGGANLDFIVFFNAAVTVTGTPRIPLTLDTGGTVYLNYVSGSGTVALTFRYVVQPGNLDGNGVALGAAIEANGGTLQSATAVDAVLTLNGVPSTAGVQVDATPFNVTAVVVPSAGTYGIGQVLSFVVTFNKPAYVNLSGGRPRIPLVLDSGTVNAEYVSGHNSSQFTFSYQVVDGSFDPNGIALGAAIDQSLAVIRDAPGNAVAGSLSVAPSTAGILVDGARPAVASITRLLASPTALTQVTFGVTFTEAVTGVDLSDFTLTATGTATGTLSSFASTGATTYTITVSSVSGDGTLRLDLKAAGTGIADASNNQLTSGYTAGDTYTIDNTAPTVGIGPPSELITGPGPVNFTITYTDTATITLVAGNVTLDTTGTVSATVAVSGTGSTTRTVSLTGITGAGTVAIRLAAGTGADAAGNLAPGAGPSASVLVNQSPVVAIPIPNQTRAYKTAFAFAVPPGTFSDPNAEQTLTYVATGVPSGVTFDPATRTFSGIAAIGSYTITVTATDNGAPARSASASFTLTVTKAPLTVSAANKARPYGSANPELTATFTGFVGGETLATSGVTGAPVLSTSATPASGVGTFPITITAGTLAAENYTFTVVPGTLTVEPAPLVVTAESKTRVYNSINPPLTWVITGFVNGETQAVLSGEPVITTDANAISQVGTYPIRVTRGTLVASNYAFSSFVEGVFTISPAPVQITIDGLFRSYTGQPHPVSATTVPAGNRVSFTYNGSPIAPTNAGSYTVVASSADSNFTGTATATLSIAKAAQTITFLPASAAPGVPIPLTATSSVGLPVTFILVSGNATLTDNTLVLAGTGSVTVRAFQEGTVNYQSASLDRVITPVSLLAQSITANPLANRPANAPPFAVSAAASSGLPVTVSVVSGPATVAGTTVTLTGQPGIVVLRVSQPGNTTYAAATPVDLTFTVTPVGNDRIVNVSSRARIAAADRVLITGFVIGGNAPKQVLVRGIGPALAQFGLPDVLAAPNLRIFRGGDVIAENRGWSSGTDTAALTAAFARVGAFPLTVGAADSAVLVTLPPGAYTTHLSGGTGVALAEIYDASANPLLESQRLINVSIRSEAGSGDGALIAGFVIAGSTPKRVLIRGIGPSLVPFGVADALADTRLQVVGSAQTVVGENDNWDAVAAQGAAVQAAAASVGAFALPAGSKDAAVVLTLNPGGYTAQVGPATGTGTGSALIEVYELP